MKKYECLITIKGNLDQAAYETTVAKFKEIIEKSSTEVEVDNWGKKRLAYEVQKLNEGYYTLYTFRNDGSGIVEIERLLRIDENVMKFLVTKVDEKKIAKITAEKKDKAERKAARIERLNKEHEERNAESESQED